MQLQLKFAPHVNYIEESPYKLTLRNKLYCMEIEISTEYSATKELSDLLQAHWLFCTSATPIEHVYALDTSKLFAPGITVFGARVKEELVGVGAIRELEAEHAELKSMHTSARFRGHGVGKAMVRHIEHFAKTRGVMRISLETGTSELFKPARQLYKSLGYQDCAAFADYVLSEDNICMTKLI